MKQTIKKDEVDYYVRFCMFKVIPRYPPVWKWFHMRKRQGNYFLLFSMLLTTQRPVICSQSSLTEPNLEQPQAAQLQKNKDKEMIILFMFHIQTSYVACFWQVFQTTSCAHAATCIENATTCLFCSTIEKLKIIQFFFLHCFMFMKTSFSGFVVLHYLPMHPVCPSRAIRWRPQ